MKRHSIRDKKDLRIASVHFRKLRFHTSRRHLLDQPARFAPVGCECRCCFAGCVDDAKLRGRAARVEQGSRSIAGVLPSRSAVSGVSVHRRRRIQNDHNPLVLARERLNLRAGQRHRNQQCDRNRDKDRNDLPQFLPKRM